MKKQSLLFLLLLFPMQAFCAKAVPKEDPQKNTTKKYLTLDEPKAQTQKISKSIISRNKGKLAVILAAMAGALGFYAISNMQNDKASKLAPTGQKKQVDDKEITSLEPTEPKNEKLPEPVVKEVALSALEKAIKQRISKTTDEQKKAALYKIEKDLEEKNKELRKNILATAEEEKAAKLLENKKEKDLEIKVLGETLESRLGKVISDKSVNDKIKDVLESEYRNEQLNVARGRKSATIRVEELKELAKQHGIELQGLKLKSK